MGRGASSCRRREEEEQVHAPHGEGVPHPDGGALGDLDAVDLGAALRAQVRDPPGTGLVPEKGGVLAGDGGKIEADICGGGAAQDIFPVVDGEGAAAGQAELSPLLRGVGDPQQAADGPHQHQQGEDGEEEADQGGVPPDGLGVLCQPGAQELGKGLEGGDRFRQGDPSFRGRQTGRGLQDKRSVILYHRDWRKQAGVKGETAGLRNDSGGPLLKMRYGQPCSGVRGGFPLPLERPSRPLPWSWLCMSSMVWAAKSKSLTSS